MVDICCANCGIIFGVPAHWQSSRQEDGKTFYCPNGHTQVYSQVNSEKEKLRRERDLLAQRVAQRDDEIKRQRELREAAERREAAQKANVTKLKKRASAGICPCCNRTVQALQRHMASKHPEFQKEQGINVVPMRKPA